MDGKIVIVINGKGGVGKDTAVSAVAKCYKTYSASAIDPFKEAAKVLGWNGEKDMRSRKFLSDLKQLSIGYNDYPTQYLKDRINFFKISEAEVMFIHIREPEEIDKLKNDVGCVTLLVRNPNITEDFGNRSDDGVEDYQYDYIYENVLPLDEMKTDFLRFFETKILKKGGED